MQWISHFIMKYFVLNFCQYFVNLAQFETTLFSRLYRACVVCGVRCAFTKYKCSSSLVCFVYIQAEVPDPSNKPAAASGGATAGGSQFEGPVSLSPPRLSDSLGEPPSRSGSSRPMPHFQQLLANLQVSAPSPPLCQQPHVLLHTHHTVFHSVRKACWMLATFTM
jgi:hypothetical protein